MRTKSIAAGAVLGLLGLVLAIEAAPSGAGKPPSNCEATPPMTQEVEAALEATACATVEVTKVVTGTAPPGTTFPVRVVCPEGETAAQALPQADGPPVDKTLTFPAEGGTQSILLDAATDCTITETAPPGCMLVSIDPPTVTVGSDDVLFERVLSVTVINDCEFAAAPAAIAAAPTFTG